LYSPNRSLGWRHLNFWQYETVLTAWLPRIRCERCGVLHVEVPWARPGGGFTVCHPSPFSDEWPLKLA